VASKSFTVHSRRPHSRQDQAQSISNDCQSNHKKYEFNQSSKYFEICPSQPQSIENFGGGSIDCSKITGDKSSENRVQTPGARLIIATSVVPRRRAWKPRLSITAVPRRRAWKPRLSITAVPTQGSNPCLYFTAMTKTQGPKPASNIKLDAKLEAHIPTKCEAQALP